MEIDINVLLLYRNEKYVSQTRIKKYRNINDILYTSIHGDLIYYKILDINSRYRYGYIDVSEYIKYSRKYKINNIVDVR